MYYNIKLLCYIQRHYCEVIGELVTQLYIYGYIQRNTEFNKK